MSKEYICKKCNYSTTKKNAWNRHLITQKHVRLSNFVCSKCGKSYKFMSGLSRHEIKCKNKFEKHIDDLKATIEKQTVKLNNLITSVHNKPNITNMQINLFLNHECRNAMNFQDFLDTLSLSIDDLKYTSAHGYVKGITNIFVKNLNDLNPIDRPIHCSDKNKLEFYVKDEDKWGQDTSNRKLDKGINTVTHKQIKKIKDWEKSNPDWNNTDIGVENYMTMVKQIMSMDEKGKIDIKKELGNTMNINTLIK